MFQNEYSKFLGCKFFRTVNGTLEKLRMISFVNTEYGRLENLETKETKKIKYTDLIKDYTMLNPDGYIYFNIVCLKDNIKDIVIAMYRSSDIEASAPDPYCTCRQNINDLLGQMLNVNTEEVGCCMSIDTVPEGIDYRILRACDSIDHVTSVAIYIDDKLDDILHCIKKINLFDEVLTDLFDQAVKYRCPEFIQNIIKSEDRQIYKGYCKTLKLLLQNNEFMYEVRRGFGIGTVDVSIKDNITTGKIDESFGLTDYAVNVIQSAYNFYINNYIITKYDKDINFEEITMDKILISDSNEDTYLIVFNKDDSYIDNTKNLNRMNSAEKLEMIFKGTNK